tara:strand:+ start:545 stop:799 length:255 start_codon:yes stop_codon:yes gene_type:complete
MALQQRKVINQVEVQTNGDLQVRYGNEIYDDSITAVVGVGMVGDDDYVEAVTDVINDPTWSREVIAKGTATPSAIQAFLDASKA